MKCRFSDSFKVVHYKENNFTQSIIKYKRTDYGGDSDGLLEDINVIL